MLDLLELRAVAYDDPDVTRLTDQVQDYYRSIYGEMDRSPMTSAEFASPHGLFLVGRLAGEAVAMGGWRFVLGVRVLGSRQPAEIRRMYVTPSARRRGVARQLLAELELTAAAAGGDVMVLATGPRQLEAVSLYRSCGYVDVPGYGHYAGEPQAVHLGKRLTSSASLRPAKA